MKKSVVEYLEEKINSKSSIVKAEAYWISPYGKIKPVDTRHINEIYDNPEAFGFTIEEINKIYKKYKEKPRIEGKARDEIILSLLDRGWIRIRNYVRANSWSINVNKLDQKHQELLYDWAVAMIKLSKDFKYDQINIDTPKGVVKMDMESIAKFKFNEDSKIPSSRKYILEWVSKF
jgi:hypothetical protein